MRHTAAERALYLGQAHEAPDFQSMRRGLRDWQELGWGIWAMAPLSLPAKVPLPSSRRLQSLNGKWQRPPRVHPKPGCGERPGAAVEALLPLPSGWRWRSGQSAAKRALDEANHAT